MQADDQEASDELWMEEALRAGQRAVEIGEVPVGAVIICNGRVVGSGFNQNLAGPDPTAHAEMLAIKYATVAKGKGRLEDCDLYVTKEPCPMCAGALVHTRVRRVIFGCADPAAGAAGSVINLLQMPTLNHRCDIAAGVLQDECAEILQSFFRERRDSRNKIDSLEGD